MLENSDGFRISMLEAKLQKEYNEVLHQEEVLWYKKSRAKWVCLGARNTKFFLTQTMVRRKRNEIHGLFLDNGEWCTDEATLQQEALSYYLSLFTAATLSTPSMMEVPMIPRLNDIGTTSISADVEKSEVRKAMFSMKSYKALGADGFQPLFFKHFWGTIGDDVWHLVCEAFRNGSFDPGLAETLIVLIPKIDHPVHLKNFRPISLCNVVYKVISKVLVQRLRPYLDDLIGPLQSSFIPGRSTTDNAILAQEMVHHMHY